MPACMRALAANILFSTWFLGEALAIPVALYALVFYLPCTRMGWASSFQEAPSLLPLHRNHLPGPLISQLLMFYVSLGYLSLHSILFIPCVSLLKGKFPKGRSFPVPLTCYRLCQEACLAEVKLSKILLGERDVKLGQTSIGNGLVAGLCYAYLPLLMMQLASQLVICIRCAPSPSCNNDPHLQLME